MAHAHIAQIEERKQAAKPLAASWEQMAEPDVPGVFARGLVAQAVEGIALVDEDSIIIEWNAAMAEMTGVQREVILHKHVRKLSKLMPMDPPLLQQTIKRMTKGKTSFRDALLPEWLQDPLEVRLFGTNASERLVRVKLFSIRLPGKVVVGALLEEVTERRNAQRLLEDSRKKLHNLAQSLIAAREEERKSVATRIHDELGQSLTALKMDILWLEKRLGVAGRPEQEKLADMTAIIDQTLSAVQRLSTELRPRMLEDLGLAAALKWLCEDFCRRTGLLCKAQIDLRVSGHTGAVATVIYRITQELLTNVARHAKARRVFVELRKLGRNLQLIVRDDGLGITTQQAMATESIGLIGIREQLQDLQGEFSITGARGGGTTARVRIPLRKEAPSE
jgi:PAS domain S-box-containing protein